MQAIVAFGLYMEAECKWAREQPHPPNLTACRNYHDNQSTAHSFDKVNSEARGLLKAYVQTAVQTQLDNFLGQAVRSIANAAHDTPRSHWFGILEAFAGAFLWTAFLILLSLCLRFTGIDAIEIIDKVFGHLSRQ